MTLDKAIEWAEYMTPKNEGIHVSSAGYSYLYYYVCPWNDGYIIHPFTDILRHPSLKKESVYNTKDKILKI